MMKLTYRNTLMILSLVAVSFFSPLLRAQYLPPNPNSAFSIPSSAIIQPKALNEMLQSPRHNPMLVLQVGSHLMFAQAHISGSEYAGAGSQPSGLDSLHSRVSSLSKTHLIVLYCGCCPWDRCPNVGPAYKLLHDLGYTNVKVVYMASNFADDWMAKGYPVERGN